MEFLVSGNGKLGSVLENVRGGLFPVNILLHDTVLEYPDSREQVERFLVARSDTIKNQAHYDLLPCRATLLPELGFLQADDIANILHDTV